MLSVVLYDNIVIAGGGVAESKQAASTPARGPPQAATSRPRTHGPGRGHAICGASGRAATRSRRAGMERRCRDAITHSRPGRAALRILRRWRRDRLFSESLIRHFRNGARRLIDALDPGSFRVHQLLSRRDAPIELTATVIAVPFRLAPGRGAVHLIVFPRIVHDGHSSLRSHRDSPS